MSQLVGMMQALMSRLPQTTQPASQKRAKRKRKRRRAQTVSAAGGDGVIHLSRCELLETLSVSRNTRSATGHVDLVPSSLGFLKGVSKVFDRIRWNSLQVYYKPAVGTTFGGLVSVGMDWDFATSDVDREKISGFTPSMTMAAWKDTQNEPMILPANRLQSRQWYSPNGTGDWVDKGPGKLHWAASTTTQASDMVVGELWVKYSVTMQGTNPS